jgi:predicted esterase
MEEMTFEALQAEAVGRFQAADYAAALELLTAGREQFPEQRGYIEYLRSCSLARLGETDKTVSLLQVLADSGLWFSEELLRDSPSYAPLQGNAAFEAVVAAHGRARGDADALGPLFVRRPETGCGAGCPLLFTFHGNGSSAEVEIEQWGRVAGDGWLVAAPQSASRMWAGANMSVWTGHESALAQIQTHYARLAAEHKLDPAETVLGGFSMGGEIAIWLTLSGEIPARGFVVMGPGGPFTNRPDEWLPLIQQSRGRDLRAAVILGMADAAIEQDAVRRLVAMLNEAGIPCRLIEVPELRHEFPPAFGVLLAEALSFVSESYPIGER